MTNWLSPGISPQAELLLLWRQVPSLLAHCLLPRAMQSSGRPVQLAPLGVVLILICGCTSCVQLSLNSIPSRARAGAKEPLGVQLQNAWAAQTIPEQLMHAGTGALSIRRPCKRELYTSNSAIHLNPLQAWASQPGLAVLCVLACVQNTESHLHAQCREVHICLHPLYCQHSSRQGEQWAHGGTPAGAGLLFMCQQRRH